MPPRAPAMPKPRSVSTHLTIGSNAVNVDGIAIFVPDGHTPTETALAHLRARARPELILKAHIEQEAPRSSCTSPSHRRTRCHRPAPCPSASLSSLRHV